MIYIIHGEVNSGKTTKALEIANNSISKGIISDKVFILNESNQNTLLGYDLIDIENRNVKCPFIRLISHISSNPNWNEIIQLGKRFSFSQNGIFFLEQIVEKFIQSFDDCKTFIIDEIGRLEFQKKIGFSSCFAKLLTFENLHHSDMQLYVCVRTEYVQDVIESFNLIVDEFIDVYQLNK
eukprot:TRINITY_DN1224_c0_g1_i1.p1 TRINITY_DN1224_c0_g1~~TRINITY_DN1224_c0_g1_i1.p1  ORF type:complete len:180 (-),score=42.70 TRINITY_DN1224_c0_g1_i1:9-548(-)